MRKFLSVMLICIIVIQSTLVAFAGTSEEESIGVNTAEQEAHNRLVEKKHDEVVALIGELTKLKIEKNSLSVYNAKMMEFTRVNSINTSTMEVENQLDALGVRKSGIHSQDALKSTNNVMMASRGSYEDTREEVISRFYVNGQPYTVLHEYSIPNSINSVQVSGGDGVTLYSGNGVISGVSNLVMIYAQKVVGTIPVIGWTPYELLVPSNASKLEKLTLSYTVGNTVCYSWVKPYSSSDSYYRRGMVTNYMTCESYFSSRGVKSDGSVWNKPSGTKFVDEYADNYANTAKAVYSHVFEHGRYESIINYVDIKCSLPGGNTKRVQVIAPR